MVQALAEETARVQRLARFLIDEYTAWGDKIRDGQEIQLMYRDILDFVNFRIETADSCLLLLGNRRVADALGLCRALLENYLLLMLMCRGTKFFVLEDLTDLSEGEFRRTVIEKQAEVAALRAAGETACLTVEKYPRGKRQAMHVFEGLRSPDTPGFFIPAHYFYIRDFRPEMLHLKPEDYFQYYTDPILVKADREEQAVQQALYRSYLSFDGLVHCLTINDLADDAVKARIEAHYTFLGRSLHLTHNAARDLHEASNVYDGRTGIGLGQAYTETALLLGYLYVCYLLADIVNEAADLFERAPGKYIADPGTADIRRAAARVPTAFPYFWFLTNDPPLYDRFNYCVSVEHVTDGELVAWGSYENVPLTACRSTSTSTRT